VNVSARKDSPADREFARLVLPLSDALYGQAMKLTRNPTDAEDLVQDALVRAHRFWHRFQPGTNVKAWMFTILRNAFINGYHRQRREREGLAIAEQQGALNTRSISPEDLVSDQATSIQIREALAQLPIDYRDAVTMADLEGLSYRTIGEIMGTPIGTVMSRIYRGRKILHKLLYQHATEIGMTVSEDRR
jgi:RNA polymerase sigma-70 factor (ECF subfamily)